MAINVENWRKLRESVADKSEYAVGFDMSQYIQGTGVPCGTAACLAGHAVINEYGVSAAFHEIIPPIAAKLLGLDYETEAAHVFYGNWWHDPNPLIENITRADALEYIDRVLETGNPLVSLRDSSYED